MLVLLTTLALTCQVEPASSKKPQQPIPALGTKQGELVDAGLRRELESATTAGLSWLSEQQSPRGYWQAHVGHKQADRYLILHSAGDNERRGQGHPGVTALCGMAFLAGGHLPNRGRYGVQVRRALDYTLEHVTDSGLVHDGGTRMYSHAFATLFLAEIYGMVGGPETRTALERATHIIVDSQNRHGAWRYNAFSPHADLSVTVCQLQALRAARNIGILVPRSTIDAALAYVERSRTTQGPASGLYYYKIHGRGAWRKNTQYAINAAAVTALFSAGVHDETKYATALDFLQDEYPSQVAWNSTHFFYWYGNYYACQAFFQAGGARFHRYYRQLVTDLIRLQRSDGRWRNKTGPGDAFSTAVACLLLQLPKQYLPIFQR